MRKLNYAVLMAMFIAFICAQPIVAQDQEFADKAAKGGAMEVELGRMAATKAQNAAVKSFGRRMVTDHTKAGNKLKALAKRKGLSLSTEMDTTQREEVQRLSQLKGAEFDRAYMEMMVSDHEKDVAEFEMQANSGTDKDLKMFAAQTLPTLKVHLQLAKDTAAKVK